MKIGKEYKSSFVRYFKGIAVSDKSMELSKNTIPMEEQSNEIPAAESKEVIVPLINMYTSFYRDKHGARQHELEVCLRMNINNRFIDKIFLVVDDSAKDHPLLKNDKVIILDSKVRPTYKFFFDYINANGNDNDISIISNTDIYFDDTLNLLDTIDFTNLCLALSRWDLYPDNVHKLYNHRDSQDTWIFKGHIKPIAFADFNFGKRGCDNRIAHELVKAGYNVCNPSHNIKSIHYHLSNVRNYPAPGIDDVPPPYLTIQPTDINVLPRFKRNNILHIGMQVPTLAAALEKIGDNYKFIDWVQGRSNMTELRNNIIKAASTSDIVFMHIQAPDIVDIPTAQAMKGKFVFNWTGDVRHPIPEWYKQIGAHISMTGFSNGTDVEIMRKQNIPATYLQVGFDHLTFTPEGPLTPGAAPVVFMGNNYGKFPLSSMRVQMVNFLREQYKERFKVFGGNWHSSDGNLMGNEAGEASYYRSCKIAINISHFDYERYSSDRIFRIMGSGAFCACKWYPGIEKDFVDGHHLRVWKDFNELKAIIDYYLHNEAARIAIAANGCKFVRENCTWDSRMKEFKEIIKTNKI